MKQKQKTVTERARVQATTPDQVHALFDSSQWPPCSVMNYNHIYFKNINELFFLNLDKDFAEYDPSHVKPGFQLLYLEEESDNSVKAVNFDTLYIYAIEQYYLYRYYEVLRIYFRCRNSLDIYTLHYPEILLFGDDQAYIESSNHDYYAWKNTITEEEIEQKALTRIYNSRITKLAKLGF